ncbi:MAG: CRISPR-associated helicase Cas3' [Anaerolineaceae bacterium]|nr:CRISPR-associated helicase Cas3' [Anaerolineaceae bacterium]
MQDRFIAHLRTNDREPQYLWDHLKNVSAFSGQFTNKIGLKLAGELLGLLHDLGKASKEFQNYIGSANGLIDVDDDEFVDVEAKKGKIDHATAGTQLIYRNLFGKGHEGLIAAQILSLCIASHHSRSGLIDCLSPDGENRFKRRIEKEEENTHAEEAWSTLNEEEKHEVCKLLADDTLVDQLIEKLKSLNEGKDRDHQDTFAFKCGLLIRYLYSCLIDADRLDTADFETPGNAQLRNYGEYHPWRTLILRLDEKLKEFKHKGEEIGFVDDIRNQVSQSCFDFYTKPKGVYQLKVPTGGGKTLASLRFALNHAAYYQMDRIFYVIPYTSIIDQNADQVRKILEDRDGRGHILNRVVLEHHSNLTPEEETRRQSLLSENWDAPVIFTTQVQFLESLFGSGTRSARRMHQLANSVIIFDEVQTIPVRCVHMFNLAIRFLVHGCGSTVVLCTATQPLLDKVEPAQRALMINSDQKMISDEENLFEKLKRVDVFDRRKIGGWNDEEVAGLAEQELLDKGSALIIVNTKASARSLFLAMINRNNTDVYHLSTNMCPAHRLKVLDTIKKRLENKERVTCISTQLIEAGVDIDFGSVIRYLAGLDSIAQAAGRCNRNGIRDIGNVWIVNPHKENTEKLKDIHIGIEVAERVLDEFKANPQTFNNDLLGPDAIEKYYKYYFYDRRCEMNYPVGKSSPVGRDDDLFNLLSLNRISVMEHQRITNNAPAIPFKQAFQTASKAFYAIDSPTRGIVVPYSKQGKDIISELCGAFDIKKQYKLIKKAQRYSVNLFPHEFKQMVDKRAIREAQEGSGILYLDSQYYSDQFGWCSEIVNDMELLIC